MNVVSFESAKKLKDAGFPQPFPTVGQFWYDGQYGRLSVINFNCGKPDELRISPLNCSEWSYWFDSHYLGKHIYAPSATDILSALQDHTGKPACGLYPCNLNKFTVSLGEPVAGIGNAFDNPAEAACEKWFNLRKTN